MKKIIKFYANWCAPCKAYTPIFESATSEYKDQIEVVSVNVDTDTDGIASTYKIRSIPSTVLVREDGSFIKKDGILTEETVKELILS